MFPFILNWNLFHLTFYYIFYNTFSFDEIFILQYIEKKKEFKTNSGHYLQAAQLDPNIPNPFIMNEYGNQTQTGDANKFGIGGGGNQQQIKAGPPQRPPPISGHSGSPAHGTPSKPKSAFDDLNETIRMALGSSGSPAKTADSQKVMGAQQNQPNQTSASVFSASPNHQNVNNPSTGGPY